MVEEREHVDGMQFRISTRAAVLGVASRGALDQCALPLGSVEVRPARLGELAEYANLLVGVIWDNIGKRS
jgi:hypothetical protein